MKSLRRLLSVLSFGWFISIPPAAQASLVFDNLTGASGPFFGPGWCQIGAEIILGGTSRVVRMLELGVSTQGNDLTAAIQMAIYANNGSGGSPGTLLWQSGPLTGLFVPSTATAISVNVPDIVAPDVFTVTSVIIGSAPVALGRLSPGPATIGSLSGTWVETSPGVWVTGFAFAMQVEAVPEPSMILPLATILLWLGSVHRIKARGGDHRN